MTSRTELAERRFNLSRGGALAFAVSLAVPAASAQQAQASAAAEPLPVIAVAAEAAAAPAQDSAAPASRSRFVEEIVVTSQKREENLQDVPISVQAFSGEALDALGISDQTDLQRITPGLNVSSQVSYVVTFLRGIGTDSVITTDPSVATYIDGIYYPFASNLAQNFGAVERIEVLKGPQGTLFGRNATGGAISIYTKDPSFDRFEGEAMVSFGSYESRQYRAYVNVPLTDWAAVNVSGVHMRSENFYTGTRGVPGSPFPIDDALGARVKLRLRPFDELDINLAAFRYEMHGAAANIAYTTTPSTLGALLGVQPQPGYDGALDAPVYTQTDPNVVYYGSAVYNAPWFDVKIIGSDQRMDTAGLRDFDGSPRPISAFETDDQYVDAQTAELQILSNKDWGPDWLQWIIGGYYFQGVNGFGSLDFTLVGLNIAAGSILGIPLPGGLVDFYSTLPTPNGPLNLIGLVGTDSTAAFFQTTLSLSERINLTLGGRYQVEERYIDDSSVGLANADGSRVELIDNRNRATNGDGQPQAARTTTKSFSPKVSLETRPFDDDTLVFLSWQKAEKAGTYNTVAIYDTPDYVEPEEITATEIGLKTTLLDGAARFNSGAFFYKVRNIQTNYISLFAGGVIAFENAGGAEVKGLDFDGHIALFRDHIDGLILSGGAAYIDASYTSYTDASGFGDAGFFSTNNDYSGNQIVRSPELTTSFALSKTWSLSTGSFEAVVDTYYSSKTYYEASNRDISAQDAYWLLGARLSYHHEPWDLRITLSGRNLGDEQYINGMWVTDFGVQPSYAAPRNYLVQVLWNF